MNTIAPPTTSDQFVMLTDLLKHEDNLISLRTNWTLAVQALLFSAFASTVGLFEKFVFSTPTKTPIHAALFLLCGMGLLSCVAAFAGVQSAESQQVRLREWWEKTLPEADASRYPPLYPIDSIRSRLRASKYFIVLAAVWVTIFLIVCSSQELVIRSGAK